MENVSLEKIVAMVNEILLQVSMEYDMDFKIHKLDAIRKQAGEDTIRKMQFKELKLSKLILKRVIDK